MALSHQWGMMPQTTMKSPGTHSPTGLPTRERLVPEVVSLISAPARSQSPPALLENLRIWAPDTLFVGW